MNRSDLIAGTILVLIMAAAMLVGVVSFWPADAAGGPGARPAPGQRYTVPVPCVRGESAAGKWRGWVCS